MSVQFEEAFNRFVDVYGLPAWEEKPKSGQSREEIVRMWEDELKRFTVEQVRSACYRVIRFKKNMSFPTISHLMAQLVDEPVAEDKSSSAAWKAYHDLKQFPCPRLTPEQNEMAVLRTIYRVYGVCLNGFDPVTQLEGC